MRKGHTFAGQQINHAGKRSHRQQLGYNRRVINAEITDGSMTDKLFFPGSPRLDFQVAAAHIFIYTQNFQRTASIVGINRQEKLAVRFRNVIRFKAHIAAGTVIADQMRFGNTGPVAQHCRTGKVGYRNFGVGPQTVNSNIDIRVGNFFQIVFIIVFRLFLRFAQCGLAAHNLFVANKKLRQVITVSGNVNLDLFLRLIGNFDFGLSRSFRSLYA